MLRIKEILREKNISAKELADMMGKTSQYINGVINERDSASVKVLSNIAEALNVPISSLFDDYNIASDSICPHCGKPIRIKIEKAE